MRRIGWLLGLMALIGLVGLATSWLRTPAAEAAGPSFQSISVNSNCDSQGGFTGTVTLSSAVAAQTTVTLDLWYHTTTPTTGWFDSGVSATAVFAAGVNTATYTFPAFTGPSGTNTYRIQVKNSGGLGGSTVKSNSVQPCTPVTGSPTVATTLSTASVPVGTPVTDTATLSGGKNPTGTVTFNVYNAADQGGSTCSSTVVFTSTVPLSNGSATSGAFAPSAAGTYNWQAVYSGDANNNSVKSGCGTEVLTVISTSGTCGVVGSTLPSVSPGSAIPLGNTTQGTTQDYYDSCGPNGSQSTTGAASETFSTFCAFVGPVAPAPGNQWTGAIYTDVNGAPGNLVVSTGVGTLTTGQNCLSLQGTIAQRTLSPNTKYWLLFYSNAINSSTNSAADNLFYSFTGVDGNLACGTAGAIGAYIQPSTSGFPTWSPTYPAGAFVCGSWNFSVYIS